MSLNFRSFVALLFAVVCGSGDVKGTRAPGGMDGVYAKEAAASDGVREHVILLHGLCRTERCMRPMEKALVDAGFCVLNVGYPSRSDQIERLSEKVIPDAIEQCRARGATQIHFVTHSMGGILVRSYLQDNAPKELGRVVMLGPPNQGSEIVERLGKWRLFTVLNGPAGHELGTESDSVPNRTGPAKFELGVIAGNRSINWINSLLVPGPDDGKVPVERSKLAGMRDHIVLPVTHPFLMKRQSAIQQTIEFLKNGRFACATKMGRYR